MNYAVCTVRLCLHNDHGTCGQGDPHTCNVCVHHAPAMQKQLSEAGVEHSFKRFPAEGHAFVTDLAATQQAGSASADAWAALLQFLATHLQRAPTAT